MWREADKLGELSNCDASLTLNKGDREGRFGRNVLDHLQSKEGSARLLEVLEPVMG